MIKDKQNKYQKQMQSPEYQNNNQKNADADIKICTH